MLETTEIRTSGGGALSLLWRQIHSDIFQIPVTTVSGAAEGGAYGAALVAGVAVGMWKDVYEAVSNIKIITRTEPDLENKNVYEDLYGVYSQLHKALKPSFDKLVEK